MHPCVQNKQILPQENLGVLLLEFLELYGRVFNFEEVGIGISLKRGAYYYRKVKFLIMFLLKSFKLIILKIFIFVLYLLILYK